MTDTKAEHRRRLGRLQLRGQRHRRIDSDSTMQYGPMNQATHTHATMTMVEYILEYPRDLIQRMPGANVKIGDKSKAGILTPSSDAKFGFGGRIVLGFDVALFNRLCL